MRIGKERCERKAYPHRVYPDMNRIRLRVNGAQVKLEKILNLSKYYHQKYSYSTIKAQGMDLTNLQTGISGVGYS